MITQAMNRTTLYVIAVITTFFGIVNSKDEVLVRSCPSDKPSWDTAARRKECKPEDGQDYEYHCVKNERQELVETCMVAQWIEKDICPILFHSGDFGGENCSLRTEGPCPQQNYRSNQVFRYPLCFVPETIATTTMFTSTKRTFDGTVIDRGKRDDCIFKSGGIIAGVIVPFLVFGFIVCIMRGRKARARNKKPDMEDRTVTSEEIEPFTSKPPAKQKVHQIVQLSAYAKGVEILKDTGILIITGRIGSGKTTAMNRIIERLRDQDTDLRVKDMSLWDKNNDSVKGNLLVKWDDCFGQYVANPVKIEYTKKSLQEAMNLIKDSSGDRLLILTMSDNEFRYFNVKDMLENEAGRMKSCNVCLDDLLEIEKKLFVENISRSALSDTHVKKDAKRLQIENESVTLSTLGWPSMCRILSIPYISRNRKTFTRDPFRCAINLFDELRTTNEQLYCVMIYVVFKGGSTNICRFDSAFLKEISVELAPDMVSLVNDGDNVDSDYYVKTLSRKLHCLLCSFPEYFIQKSVDYFEFHNGIFSLWLLCHFYNKYPKLTIQHIQLDLLFELFRPVDYAVEPYELDIDIICTFGEKYDLQRRTVKEEEPMTHTSGHVKKMFTHNDHLDASEEVELAIEAEEIEQYQPKEKALESKENWVFVLHEDLFSCFIDRLEKEQGKIGHSQVEGEQRLVIFRGHPIHSNMAFQRMFTQHMALENAKNSGSKRFSIKGVLNFL